MREDEVGLAPGEVADTFVVEHSVEGAAVLVEGLLFLQEQLGELVFVFEVANTKSRKLKELLETSTSHSPHAVDLFNKLLQQRSHKPFVEFGFVAEQFLVKPLNRLHQQGQSAHSFFSHPGPNIPASI